VMELIIMKKLSLLVVMFILLVSFVYASDFDIDDLTVIVGDEEYRSVRDMDQINDFIEPGTKIEFEIEFANNMRDTDIEDIKPTLTLLDATEGEHITDKVDEFDLNKDKTKIKSFKIDIPDDADEIEKTVEIYAKGVDENDTVHEIKWTIYLKIEDEDREIKIHRTKINQTTLDCSGKIDLITWIENNGKYDEDEAKLIVKNDDLGIYEEYDNLDIEEGEIYTKQTLIDIERVEKPGTYPLEITTYYKHKHLDDIKTIDITLKACKQELEVIDLEEEEETEPQVQPEEIVTEQKPKEKLPLFVLLAIPLIVLITLIMIMAIVLIIRR
jgi:hypothetical protein